MHQATDSKIAQTLAEKWMNLVNDIYGDYPQLKDKMWVALKSGAMPNNKLPYTVKIIRYKEEAIDILQKKK